MYKNVTRTKQNQLQLFKHFPNKEKGTLPSTRYQGSKYKILKWIDHYTEDLKFKCVLDAFGGTGCVGYMFKQKVSKFFITIF